MHFFLYILIYTYVSIIFLLQKKIAYCLCAEVAFFTAYSLAFMLAVHQPNSRRVAFGVISAVFNIAMYGFPLAILVCILLPSFYLFFLLTLIVLSLSLYLSNAEKDNEHGEHWIYVILALGGHRPQLRCVAGLFGHQGQHLLNGNCNKILIQFHFFFIWSQVYQLVNNQVSNAVGTLLGILQVSIYWYYMRSANPIIPQAVVIPWVAPVPPHGIHSLPPHLQTMKSCFLICLKWCSFQVLPSCVPK